MLDWFKCFKDRQKFIHNFTGKKIFWLKHYHWTQYIFIALCKLIQRYEIVSWPTQGISGHESIFIYATSRRIDLIELHPLWNQSEILKIWRIHVVLCDSFCRRIFFYLIGTYPTVAALQIIMCNCIQFCFLPLIQRHLNMLGCTWNLHRIKSQRDKKKSGLQSATTLQWPKL